jgi:hypothetical protein
MLGYQATTSYVKAAFQATSRHPVPDVPPPATRAEVLRLLADSDPSSERNLLRGR